MKRPEVRDLFEALVRDHARELDLFVRAAVRDPGLADDLFQETLLVAWRRLGEFDRRRPFGPWLRGIAGNLIRKARGRRAADDLVGDDRVLELLEQRCASLRRVSGDDLEGRLAVLDECLEALPGPMRTAVDSRYRDDESSEGLAQRLQTTAANARKILERARRQLGDCIERKLEWCDGN